MKCCDVGSVKTLMIVIYAMSVIELPETAQKCNTDQSEPPFSLKKFGMNCNAIETGSKNSQLSNLI